MPAAYLVGHVTITNLEGYSGYSARVPGTLKAFGGSYLVRGGQATMLEGGGLGERHVVIAFPSREKAEAWYNSEAYQAIIGIRQANSVGQLVLVDGLDVQPV